MGAPDLLLTRCEVACAGSDSGRVAKPDHYLHPGGMLVSAEPCMIVTILGSCVSVCLWDTARRIGGMNHFLLPRQLGREARVGRFGKSAVPLLIERLEGLGSRRRDLTAKVFGGASINTSVSANGRNLGRENVEVALELLECAGIPIVAQDTCGDFGRKVLFETDDGAAWVRRIGDGAHAGRR